MVKNRFLKCTCEKECIPKIRMKSTILGAKEKELKTRRKTFKHKY